MSLIISIEQLIRNRILDFKTIERQVQRDVARYNIPDHATTIFEMKSLRDKLHSVTAPLEFRVFKNSLFKFSY